MGFHGYSFKVCSWQKTLCSDANFEFLFEEGILNQTLKKAIEAYGGKETWTKAKSIKAEFSAKGLAFVFKQRPQIKRADITMDISRPFSRITPIGKTRDISGILDGPNVHLENAGGEVVRYQAGVGGSHQ